MPITQINGMVDSRTVLGGTLLPRRMVVILGATAAKHPA
jgi:hypothetical protein